MVPSAWQKVVTACSLFASTFVPNLCHAQSALNQHAVVNIKAKCQDLEKGQDDFEPEGTGFLIEEHGYVLTAYHVVSCFNSTTKRQLFRDGIALRMGSPTDPLIWTATLISSPNEQSDLALLQIQSSPHKFPTLKACSLRDPTPTTDFLAAGFPQGQALQPVNVKLGAPADGFWSAASDFTYGMSGGPVTSNGFVVGLIKSGQPGVTALNRIIPIYKATSMLKDAGIDLQDCTTAHSGGQQEEWVLHSSVMTMTIEGNTLQFFYKHPRDELREYGIKEGSLNFEGTLSGTMLAGSGYVYSPRCGQVGFHAEGTFENSHVVLHGFAPSGFNEHCQATTSRYDESTYYRSGAN